MSIQTTDSLKKKASVIRTFLKERYDVDVSQGHSLELISKIFGFKDWNTASASLKPKTKQSSSPVQIVTVGDLKKALEGLDDSAMIEADYTFKVKDLELDAYNDPEDEIYQEYTFSLEERAKDIVILQLELIQESVTSTYDGSFIGYTIR